MADTSSKWQIIRSLTDMFYRHKKRGTVYGVLAVGELQVEPERVLKDGDRMVVYFGEDNRCWIRHTDEFSVGRFEYIPKADEANTLEAEREARKNIPAPSIDLNPAVGQVQIHFDEGSRTWTTNDPRISVTEDGKVVMKAPIPGEPAVSSKDKILVKVSDASGSREQIIPLDELGSSQITNIATAEVLSRNSGDAFTLTEEHVGKTVRITTKGIVVEEPEETPTESAYDSLREFLYYRIFCSVSSLVPCPDITSETLEDLLNQSWLQPSIYGSVIERATSAAVDSLLNAFVEMAKEEPKFAEQLKALL